jgi:hypothetical protein
VDFPSILPSVVERPDTAPPSAPCNSDACSPLRCGPCTCAQVCDCAALQRYSDCRRDKLPRWRVTTAPASTASKPPPPLGIPSSQARTSAAYLDADGSLGEEPMQSRRSSMSRWSSPKPIPMDALAPENEGVPSDSIQQAQGAAAMEASRSPSTMQVIN